MSKSAFPSIFIWTVQVQVQVGDTSHCCFFVFSSMDLLGYCSSSWLPSLVILNRSFDFVEQSARVASNLFTAGTGTYKPLFQLATLQSIESRPQSQYHMYIE
mmetsp:Transcript_32627/g.79320  ORF Transcript_32627/g.79320 Transcript_32627/m.79320 type:complete len:102 (+) Transcript_32627:258-563(+)